MPEAKKEWDRLAELMNQIGERGTRSIKQLNELFAGNGMIGFVAKERVDGKLLLPEAVQIMKLKAAE